MLHDLGGKDFLNPKQKITNLLVVSFRDNLVATAKGCLAISGGSLGCYSLVQGVLWY